MFSERIVFGAFILTGVANAVVKPASLAVAETGWGPSLINGFGINAIVWMALGIGLWRIWSDNLAPATARQTWLLALCSIGFLVPLASVSWVVLGAGCIGMAVLAAPSIAVKGLAIVGLAAIRDPLAKMFLDVLAEPLLTLDAFASSLLLHLSGEAVDRTGNIMSITGDHALLIMSGCSSFTNVSLALLAYMAVLIGFSQPSWRVLCFGGLALGIAVILLNSVRLSLMALSIDAYHIVHDGWGADAFLMATTFLIFASVLLGLRHARA